MDWLERMKNSMDYIETHMSENIDYDEVARIACCSTYHFQRMFSFITDVSTGLYIDGQGDIHRLWRRIFSEWFPTCNYEQSEGPEFEMTYYRGNNMYEMEVWIPVMRKTKS